MLVKTTTVLIIAMVLLAVAALLMVAAVMPVAVPMIATIDRRRGAVVVTGGAAVGAVIVVVIVVALITPISSHRYSVPNPPVEIGTPRITLGSACVPFRLRYPPIPLLRGNGLIEGEGTPRITVERTERVGLVNDDGNLLLILMSRPPLPPARVVSGRVGQSTSTTRSGSNLSVTTTRGRGPGRQVGEGSLSTVRRRLTNRPHDTPVTVGVRVTAMMADVDDSLTMDVLWGTV
jgi:hypothetical protein